jgi:ABC-type amino acid transport substrate-binding protein
MRLRNGSPATYGRFILLLLWLCGVALTEATETRPTRYTVQPGDTLATIAAKFYKNPALWQEIYRANQPLIRNMGVIQVGWTLLIPPPPTTASPSATPPPTPSGSSALLPQANDKKLTLVTGNEDPPFTDETLPQQGMLTEIVRTAFTAAGYDVDIKFWEWQEGVRATREGVFAGAFAHSKEYERRGDFLASAPLYRVLIRAYVHKANAMPFGTLADLQGRTVCRPEGLSVPDLEALGEQKLMTLHTPKSLETCFNLLVRRKVDVVVVSELGGHSMLQSLGFTDEVCVLDKALAIDTLHLLLPGGKPHSRVLLAAFEKALEQLDHSGQLQEITARHLRQYYQDFPTPPASCIPARAQPAETAQNLPLLRPQPGEFLALAPPKRPPTQLELVSIAVADRPTLDGQATERLWEIAPTVTTLDSASQRPITLKSVHTTTEIFFLVTFPDQAPSETHRSWKWDVTEKVYKPLGDREDVFVFKWSMAGPEVSLALRTAEPHRADVWFWKALRTNPMGYADDTLDLLLPEPHPEALLVTSSVHGRLYLRHLEDTGQSAYEEKFVSEYQGDVLPRFFPRPPHGSRADVRAKGVWHRGTWTIELGRKLHTGHEDDLAFDPGGVYLFAVSCYEMAAGKVAPELTQPLYKSGDAFDRLLLRIARSNEG